MKRHNLSGFFNILLTFVLLISLSLLNSSCSKQRTFLVNKIVDYNTLELENGNSVNLIGVNGVSAEYKIALNGVVGSYVLLYDENYDQINEITQNPIDVYVYDVNENCLNDLAGTTEVVQNENTESQHVEVESTTSDTTERISGKTITLMPQLSLPQLYEKNKFSVFLVAVPMTEETYAQGTGFFISSTGIGVSNYHVFENGDNSAAVIKTVDGHQYRITTIYKSDKELDYIVFQVENNHNDFPFLNIASEQIGVGEEVFAIGNPRGLEHTLSKGIISSYRENNKLIQITAEITHGSSGGPLFNMKGEVIGITTSGYGEANLNFAMNIVKLGIGVFAK